MDRLDQLRVFAAVADKASFAEAARLLGVSPTAASRGVASLEESLGVALLRRTTRSVALTPEGAAYLERCRRALDELDDGARSIRGDKAEPRGLLVVTAPVLFGRLHILPIVTRLLSAHPDLTVRLTLTDRYVRLVDEGVDVAVRVGELGDSSMHAIHITEVWRALVASPAYLAARGEPKEAGDLRAHDLIAFEIFTSNGEWRFGSDLKIVVRIEPRLTTDSVEAAIDAAIDGAGIARTLNYQTDDHVAAGRLRYILPDLNPPPLPVNLVYQANRLRSPNVRAFLDEGRRAFRRGAGQPVSDGAVSDRPRTNSP
jgi:DNA-binding transcriptional LysR family regulator